MRTFGTICPLDTRKPSGIPSPRAIDRYVESALPALRSRRVVGAQLARWREHLGAFRLSDLTPEEIMRQRDALRGEPGNRRRRVANATLNRYVAALDPLEI
jgi:hypothetical protein